MLKNFDEIQKYGKDNMDAAMKAWGQTDQERADDCRGDCRLLKEVVRGRLRCDREAVRRQVIRQGDRDPDAPMPRASTKALSPGDEDGRALLRTRQGKLQTAGSICQPQRAEITAHRSSIVLEAGSGRMELRRTQPGDDGIAQQAGTMLAPMPRISRRTADLSKSRGSRAASCELKHRAGCVQLEIASGSVKSQPKLIRMRPGIDCIGIRLAGAYRSGAPPAGMQPASAARSFAVPPSCPAKSPSAHGDGAGRICQNSSAIFCEIRLARECRRYSNCRGFATPGTIDRNRCTGQGAAGCLSEPASPDSSFDSKIIHRLRHACREPKLQAAADHVDADHASIIGPPGRSRCAGGR